MQRLCIGVLFLVVALNAGDYLPAQTATGTILGTVRDEKGSVVPGVAVTASVAATNTRRETITSETGDYSFPLLPAARYDISAEISGFKRTTVENVELQVGRTARVDLVLQIGQISDQVTVSGAAPVVQTEEASVGSVIDSHSVSELPLNGRQFLQLTLLVPGVNPGRPGVGSGPSAAPWNRPSASTGREPQSTRRDPEHRSQLQHLRDQPERRRHPGIQGSDEFFNLFNTPHFGLPVNTMTSGSFG